MNTTERAKSHHELLGNHSSRWGSEEESATTATRRAAYEEPEGMGLWSGEVGSTMVAGHSSGPTGAASYVVAINPTGFDAQDSSQHDAAECVVTITAAQEHTYRPRLNRHRSLTLSGPIRVAERATDDELLELKVTPRPRPKIDCVAGGWNEQRPCPFVACKHHLYIEVNPITGSVRLPFGALEMDEMPYTCALDAAGDGPLTLEEVGDAMNLTKERVRQIEIPALVKMRDRGVSPSMLNPRMTDWLEDL